MKTIIYTGVALFSLATVYGVTDYYQSEKKGTLKNLYEETAVETETERTINAEEYSRGKIEEEATLKQEQTIVPTASLENKKQVVIKKTKKKNTIKVPRTIRLSEFSRGRIAEPTEVIDEDTPIAVPVIEEEVKPVPAEEVKQPVEKIVTTNFKERKLNLTNFSRASLKVKRDTVKKQEADLYNN